MLSGRSGNGSSPSRIMESASRKTTSRRYSGVLSAYMDRANILDRAWGWPHARRSSTAMVVGYGLLQPRDSVQRSTFSYLAIFQLMSLRQRYLQQTVVRTRLELDTVRGCFLLSAKVRATHGSMSRLRRRRLAGRYYRDRVRSLPRYRRTIQSEVHLLRRSWVSQIHG